MERNVVARWARRKDTTRKRAWRRRVVGRLSVCPSVCLRSQCSRDHRRPHRKGSGKSLCLLPAANESTKRPPRRFERSSSSKILWPDPLGTLQHSGSASAPPLLFHKHGPTGRQHSVVARNSTLCDVHLHPRAPFLPPHRPISPALCRPYFGACGGTGPSLCSPFSMLWKSRISEYIITFHVSTGRSASLNDQSKASSASGSSVGSW